MCDNSKIEREGLVLWKQEKEFYTRQILLYRSSYKEEGDYELVNAKTGQGGTCSTVIYLPIEAIETLIKAFKGN